MGVEYQETSPVILKETSLFLSTLGRYEMHRSKGSMNLKFNPPGGDAGKTSREGHAGIIDYRRLAERSDRPWQSLVPRQISCLTPLYPDLPGRRHRKSHPSPCRDGLNA